MPATNGAWPWRPVVAPGFVASSVPCNVYIYTPVTRPQTVHKLFAMHCHTINMTPTCNFFPRCRRFQTSPQCIPVLCRKLQARHTSHCQQHTELIHKYKAVKTAVPLTCTASLSATEVRPVVLFCSTSARLLAISVASSWHSEVCHHFVSLSHASWGQL